MQGEKEVSKEDRKKGQMRKEINVGEGDLTHYLGNDDYFEQEDSSKEEISNPKLDGFEAQGNEDDEDLRINDQ